MKKYLPIILLLLIALILPSCAGIGDDALAPGNVGAVLDNKEEITNAEPITEPTVTEPAVTESIENDSAETEPAETKSDLNTERSSFAQLGKIVQCGVFRYNLSGTMQDRSYPVNDLAEDIYTALAYGKIDSTSSRKENISDYISVEFIDQDGNVEKYCVWSDNYVMKMRVGASGKNTPLGKIRGAYAECEKYCTPIK